MINLILLMLSLSFFWVAWRICKIEESINYDTIERTTSDYYKYYKLYEKCCSYRKIVIQEGLSIKEMKKVIDETVLKY